MSKFDLREVLTEKLLKRFWEKVNKRGLDECWEWQAANAGSKRPYGQFFILWPDGTRHIHSAHRISWIIENREIPDKDIDVCHRCDNPKCVNPNHLFLGSRKENMQDCINKGRNSPPPVKSGEDANGVKLTWEIVRMIRAVPDGKRGPLKAIREKYGISKANIKNIRQGRTWRE